MIGEWAEGKFAEACRSADEALLNVLVIARTWLDHPVTKSDVINDGFDHDTEPHTNGKH